MDDNKNFSRPDPENLPQTPNADNASEAADDIDDVIKIFHKDNSDIHLHKDSPFRFMQALRVRRRPPRWILTP